MTVRPRVVERPRLDHWEARVDLAAALRWTARLDMHEAVANHFSLAVDLTGTRFLINPNQMHFSRIRASDLLELDANDTDALSRPGAPDATAWGLHGPLHRRCPHARCVMHLHAPFATVLASLEDSILPPIDLNTATFFNRMIVDEALGGLPFEAEGKRCAAMLTDPRVRIMVMGTWHVGKDSQMPFDTPMTLGGWLTEISGLGLLRFHATVMARLASGRYSEMMKAVTPQDKLRKMTRNAWVFLAVYAAIGVAIALGVH